MFRFLSIILIGAGFGLSTDVRAEDTSNNEYSFRWLDPDKKIYVLQNRKFRKAGRFQVTGMGGLGLSNPYRDTYNLDVRATFFLTEAWGVEGFYMISANQDNTTFQELTSRLGSQPFMPRVRNVTGELGGLIHWAPWYAKINVFNTILHFDWYFSFGAGQIKSDLDTRDASTDAPQLVSQDFFAGYLGTGHQYHLTENFIVRVDFLAALYNAPLLGTSGAATWFTNFTFNVGVGLRL